MLEFVATKLFNSMIRNRNSWEFISISLYLFDQWFSSQIPSHQLHLDGWQIVAAVCLTTFLQGVVAVRENQRQQLSLWMAQDQLGFWYPLQGNNVLPEGTRGLCVCQWLKSDSGAALLCSAVTPSLDPNYWPVVLATEGSGLSYQAVLSLQQKLKQNSEAWTRTVTARS